MDCGMDITHRLWDAPTTLELSFLIIIWEWELPHANIFMLENVHQS